MSPEPRVRRCAGYQQRVGSSSEDAAALCWALSGFDITSGIALQQDVGCLQEGLAQQALSQRVVPAILGNRTLAVFRKISRSKLFPSGLYLPY